MSTLVENVVGRQQLLGVTKHNGTVAQDEQTVFKSLARAATGRRRPYHPAETRRRPTGGDQPVDARHGASDERGVIQQVARRIARQRQFRKDDDRRRFAARGQRRLLHALDVAVEVANRRIELRDRETQRIHQATSG